MKPFTFAQFFHPSTGYVDGTIPPRFDGEKKPIEACGTDGVFILDGRLSYSNMIEQSNRIALQRRYIGFQLRRGDFKSNNATSQLILLPN